jgi:ParB-like nuclease domain
MAINPEAHLDRERVAHYVAQVPDAIDPVVVFGTPEGLLLADGYHRLAAARRRGATTVNAEIRLGTRPDAFD